MEDKQPPAAAWEIELTENRELAERLTAAKQFKEALKHWKVAIDLAHGPDARAELLCLRSKCYCDYSRHLTSLSAAEGERRALIGLDPTQLASLAAKDAARALKLRGEWLEGLLAHGQALLLLEDYRGAEAAFLSAISVDSEARAAQDGIAAVNEALKDSKIRRKRKLHRDLDEFDCTICCKLLYRPVTTPCGHTFCQSCFARSNDHSNKCPMCRRVLHTGRNIPVTVTLESIIAATFPEETAARRRESASFASPEAGSNLPMFIMSPMLPGESIGLNIFEPRYRLMVRRCLEGNRRLAMTCALQVEGAADHTIPDVVTECEIEDCQVQPDGRFSLQCKGVRRVRAVRHWEQDGYRVCSPVPLKDEPSGEAVGPLREAIEANLDKALAAATTMVSNSVAGAGRTRLLVHLSELGNKPGDVTAEDFSWWAARMLNLPTSTKLHLLMMTDTRERLQWLQEHTADGAKSAHGILGQTASECCIM